MGAEGWRVWDEEAEKRGLGNYAIWKSGSGQAIISSSSLFYWLPSKKWTKTAGAAKQRTGHIGEKYQKQKAVFSLQYVCGFFHNKKISRSSWKFTDKQWLLQVAVCSLRVNTGCECDMSGQTRSLPECYSIRARRVWGHMAAGRTAVSEGPSEDRPLKRGQTADWQRRWTPDCIRPYLVHLPSYTAKTHPSCHVV